MLWGRIKGTKRDQEGFEFCCVLTSIQHAGNPSFHVTAIFKCPLSSHLHYHSCRSAYVVNKFSLISTSNNLTLLVIGSSQRPLSVTPFRTVKSWASFLSPSCPCPPPPPLRSVGPLSFLKVLSTRGLLFEWTLGKVRSFWLIFLSLWKVFLWQSQWPLKKLNFLFEKKINK